MDIDPKQIKVYIISPATHKYEKRLFTVFERVVHAGFQRVEFFRSIPSTHTVDSLSLTVAEIFMKELHTSEPFIILEDDCELWHHYKTIHIPHTTSLLYLGASSWAYPHSLDTIYLKHRPHICNHSHHTITPYNEDLVKVKAMTGGHAILFNCRKFMKEFIEIFSEMDKISQVPHDLVFSAMMYSDRYKAYALKKPMFYQDKQLGGQEDVTKIVL